MTFYFVKTHVPLWCPTLFNTKRERMPGNESVEPSPWVSRSMKVMLCPGTQASISRFIVDFAAKVTGSDCIDECDEGCNNCMERGRNYQVFLRIAVGPALKQAGKPDKRGIRLDSWCGMTHEPDSERYEGALIDADNQIILEQGAVVMLKVPRLETETVTAFPGLGLMIEWPQCEDSDHHDLLVMPTSVMPMSSMMISPVNYHHHVLCPCPNPAHHNSKCLPDFVPKMPPAPPPTKPVSRKSKTSSTSPPSPSMTSAKRVCVEGEVGEGEA